MGPMWHHLDLYIKYYLDKYIYIFLVGLCIHTLALHPYLLWKIGVSFDHQAAPLRRRLERLALLRPHVAMRLWTGPKKALNFEENFSDLVYDMFANVACNLSSTYNIYIYITIEVADTS